MKPFVITIGRHSRSGGSSIARELAKRLGVEVYDRNLLRLASDESGISEELFINADEKLKSTSIFKAAKKVYQGELLPPESGDFTSDRNLFNYQAKVLRELARKESFVVVGRCADHVLEKVPNITLLRVFVSASDDFCIDREEEYTKQPRRVCESKVNKLNRARAEYYTYYTGKKWDDPKNYDMCLCPEKIGMEESVDLILTLLQKKQEKERENEA